MKNNKIKIYELGIFLCIFSLFILPRAFRRLFLQGYASFNIFFYIGLFIFIRNKKEKIKASNKSNKLFFTLVIFSLSSILIFVSHGYSDVNEKITYIFVNCMPLFIVRELLDYKNDKFARFAEIWYKILKIICILLVITWVIDKFTNKSIEMFIANLYKVPSIYGCIMENRFISIYGHSLFNAVLMFSLLLWTLLLYSNNVKVKNYIFTIMISLLGIAITGSKSIFLLALLLLIVNFANKKNIKYVIPLAVIAFALYKFGFLDVTLNRLSSGLESGDISSNRNSSIIRLTERNILQFNFFKGHYIDDSIHGLIASLEYPILRWAYKSGILFALLLTVYYFIIPIFKIMKNNKKNVRVIISMILYMLTVNINDSLTSNCDALIMYIMNLCLLNYIINNNKYKLEKKNDMN